MLIVKLKDAMEAYRRRTGERITYGKLSCKTGIAESTLKKIGSTLGQHTTLASLEKISVALNVTPGDLLEIIPDPPKVGTSRQKKRAEKPR